MSREIYALLFNLSTALTVQLQNNALAIDKETIFVAIQNNLEEVSNFHKIMRIVSVVTLTLMGIIATIMFSWNILDYQRAQKRFHLKPRSPESIIQSSNTLTEQENNEKKEKEFGASTSSNISEYSTGLEPKSTDFPTLMPSKSRSSAGQADSLYNKAVIHKSVDTAVEADKAVNYPTKFLNSLNLPGMPPHVLQLKIDVPIIMLRNINQPKLSNCKHGSNFGRHSNEAEEMRPSVANLIEEKRALANERTRQRISQTGAERHAARLEDA
ncbi:unnamed protein product [Onchocerca ochengi]|uniref:ATP-dependent DNA helicase n=1 Tax=Onchocerca ochengi TaxID=42157 RepID=A0A182EA28_ONCOC|nr:unnamed protein product [Onchocerca ochengi]